MKVLKVVLTWGAILTLVLFIAYNPAKAEAVLVGALDLLTSAVRWAANHARGSAQ